MDDYNLGRHLLTDQAKIELEKVAAAICKNNDLPHAYFVQRFGKRRHYIAGYGKEAFTKTHHKDINENIALYWEGEMTEENALLALSSFNELLYQVVNELKQP